MSVLPYAPMEPLPPRRVWRAFGVWGMAQSLGWVAAVITNGVNGVVSTEYFDLVMGGRWDWLAVVMQGIFESTLYGFLGSLVLVPLYCGLTGCRYPLGRWRLGGVWIGVWVVGLVVVGHLLGGMVGAAWATFGSQSFKQEFWPSRGASHLTHFGYVGGAIWGAMFTGAMSVLMLVLTLVFGWRRFVRDGGYWLFQG